MRPARFSNGGGGWGNPGGEEETPWENLGMVGRRGEPDAISQPGDPSGVGGFMGLHHQPEKEEVNNEYNN